MRPLPIDRALLDPLALGDPKPWGLWIEVLKVFFGMPSTFLAAVGLVAMLAAAANTPIAAAVMAMELLPGPVGVYAVLAAATAFLMVGHRSVYASQKIGLSKSAGLDVQLGGPIGDVSRASVRIRKGSLTEPPKQSPIVGAERGLPSVCGLPDVCRAPHPRPLRGGMALAPTPSQGRAGASINGAQSASFQRPSARLSWP